MPRVIILLRSLHNIGENGRDVSLWPKAFTAVPEWLTSAASQNQLQAGCDDLQDPQHRFTGIGLPE